MLYRGLPRAIVEEASKNKDKQKARETSNYMSILAEKLIKMKPDLEKQGHDTSWIQPLYDRVCSALT